MLGKDGYCSIYKMFLYAETAIYRALDPTIRQERAKTEQRPSWGYLGYNVQIAARYLVIDVINHAYKDKAGGTSVMKPDGTLLSISPQLIRPVNQRRFVDRFYKGLSEARKEGGITRNDEMFGLSFFKYDFWHLPFMEEEIFSERTLSFRSVTKHIYSEIPIFDWDTSTIDLTNATRFLDAIEQFRASHDALKSLGFTVSSRADAHLEGLPTDLRGVLKLLAPYDGHSVVVPASWLRYFDSILPAADRDDVGVKSERRDPRSLILSMIQSGEPFTKAIAKSSVIETCGISSRKFDGYWNALVDQFPEISKPGPKKYQKKRKSSENS